jgi:hypothetical protein
VRLFGAFASLHLALRLQRIASVSHQPLSSFFYFLDDDCLLLQGRFGFPVIASSPLDPHLLERD